MPELPDVEAYRRIFAGKGLDREVCAAHLCDPGIARDLTQDRLDQVLKGACFTTAARHGKLLFLRIGGGPWLVLHFGMTGDIAFYDAEDEAPDHARLVLDFADGGHFAFDNQRKFGWVAMAADMADYVQEAGLGPDALEVGQDEFSETMVGGRGMIKPALMDQEKIAGIGNVYSDEMLFRARLLPHAGRDSLNGPVAAALYDAMRDVLSEAADLLERREPLPDEWLAAHRSDAEHCPRCGAKLESREISGRTGWYCPACQGDRS